MKRKKKKLIHCANCGMALETYPKALPKTGRIITLIPPHECLSEPLDLDIKPLNVPMETVRQEKSTAPVGILGQLNALPNSNPEGDFDEPANE